MLSFKSLIDDFIVSLECNIYNIAGVSIINAVLDLQFVLYFEFLLLQEVEIVLTAHPTQINRRTLQYKHIRIAVSFFTSFGH
jgi:hypothetical protein